MKILTLSDLDWNKEAKEISEIDISEFPVTKEFSENRLLFRSMKYRSFWRYKSIIEEAKPDIVLLAGDITGDGSCGHGYHKSLFLLLRYLELTKTTTFFISGNHDEPKYFKYILYKTKDFKHVEYIAGKVVKYGNIKILGLDYNDSFNKTKLKSLLAQNHTVDIVLSHCHLHRRTWLFDFNTKYVITGHNVQNIGLVENKVFISIENDTDEDINYFTIKFDKNNQLVTYYNVNSITNKTKIHSSIKKSNSFDYEPNSTELTKTKFCDAVNLLRKTKKIGFHKLNRTERKKLEWIISPDFSKAFFTDYLGVKFLDTSDGYGLKLKRVLTKDMLTKITDEDS